MAQKILKLGGGCTEGDKAFLSTSTDFEEAKTPHR